MSKSKPTKYSSLSLRDIVCLCAEPCDHEAWEEFVSRVGKPIRFTVMRTISLWSAPSPSLAEDLMQATYLKLWEGGRELLRQFAIQRPEAIVGYLKRTAANVVHDYFKHSRSQSSGGGRAHVSTTDEDVETRKEAFGSQERVALDVFLKEVDELLRGSLTGVDQERDRTIFWLYFRQGMSTQEIASLPTIGLSAKGVGSVIERLKNAIRNQILHVQTNSELDTEIGAKVNSFGKSY